MRKKIIFSLGIVSLLGLVFGLKQLPGNATADELQGKVLGEKTDEAFSRSTLPDILELTKPPVKLNDSNPEVSAGAVILQDMESSYPLYAENETESVPIASVTKIMTAIITLENYQLEDEVVVSENAASTIGSSIDLLRDEVITVESLLHALIIQSGNDAAVALAEKMSYETFINNMNEKAKAIGLTDTVFRDPAGLDDEGRSTAKDLSILASYALRNPTLKKIASIQEETVFSTDGLISHDLKTSNRLIKHDHPLFLSEATGLKTGFTPDAGHCLVSSATKDGHTLISVVLNTNEYTVEASAKESRKLLIWGFENHKWE